MILKIRTKSGREFLVDEKVYTNLENYLASASGTFLIKSCFEIGKTSINKDKAFRISEIETIEELS